MRFWTSIFKGDYGPAGTNSLMNRVRALSSAKSFPMINSCRLGVAMSRKRTKKPTPLSMGEWLSLEDTKNAFRHWQAEERRKRGRSTGSTTFSTQVPTQRPTLSITSGDPLSDGRSLSNPNDETSLGFYDFIEDRYLSEREIWEDMVRRWKEVRTQELIHDIVEALGEDLSKRIDAKVGKAPKETEENTDGKDEIEIDWNA